MTQRDGRPAGELARSSWRRAARSAAYRVTQGRIVSAFALCAAVGCGSSARSPGATAGAGASEPGRAESSSAQVGPTNSAAARSPSGGAAGTSAPLSGPAVAPPSGSTIAPAHAMGAAATSTQQAAALDADAGAQLPTGGEPPPAPNCPNKAYVSNSGSDSVSVIDTLTNKVLATVPTGKAPVNPTFTPDRRQVYVSNSQADTITIIDVETDMTTTLPAGGERPSGLAFSPDGKTLFVSLISQDYVSPGSVLSIELSTGQVSAKIGMGADPERIALTPGGERLYVNNLLDGTMAVIDAASREIIATLMLGDLPFNPLMAPDGAVVYVGVMSADHVAVIDTQTNQIVRTIPADSPNGMTFSQNYESLFVSNAFSGTVQEVSLTSNKILKTQMVGGLPGNIALLPDGKRAYMVRPDGSTVEVLDTSSLMIVDTISVGSGPSVVTVARCDSAGDML